MLKNWLTKNQCWGEKGKSFTHTLMDGGLLNIPPDKMENFNQIYCESIRSNERVCVVESITRPTFKFFVDVDFVDEQEMSFEMLTDICDICRPVINKKDDII